MTKQEEIREGIEKIIKEWIIRNYPIGKETFSDLVKRIQVFEDSQGVVIKVDREWNIGETDAYGTICNPICHNMERKLLKDAGYVAVASLIESKQKEVTND